MGGGRAGESGSRSLRGMSRISLKEAALSWGHQSSPQYTPEASMSVYCVAHRQDFLVPPDCRCSRGSKVVSSSLSQPPRFSASSCVILEGIADLEPKANTADLYTLRLMLAHQPLATQEVKISTAACSASPAGPRILDVLRVYPCPERVRAPEHEHTHTHSQPQHKTQPIPHRLALS